MRTKRFSPIILLASCFLTASSCFGQPPSTAGPISRNGRFPRRGYIISYNKANHDVLATLGRRSSTHAAERAAMRMLSRLLRRYPQADRFDVEWETLEANRKVERRSLTYIENITQSGESEVYLATLEREYFGVNRRIISKVARQGGILRDLTRYDVADLRHPIDIDLGFRASYDAGSRASMRTLARCLSGPFNAMVEITWKYRLPGNQDRIASMRVSYSPNWQPDQLMVERDTPPDSYDATLGVPSDNKMLVSLGPVRRGAIRAVGRRSGTFRDLLKYGARGHVDEK